MKKISNYFKERPVLKRILITLGFITLFRLGTAITMPGATVINDSVDPGSFYGILDMLGGGGLAGFSILALGVTPYITAGIIIQLLSSDVVPYLSNLKKKGEAGRIKQEKITRIVAIGFAVLMGMAITLSMEQSGMIEFTGLYGEYWANVMVMTLILVAGTMMSIWIADKITMKGIGNGTSVIIFTGIVAGIPSKIMGTYDFLLGGESGYSVLAGVSYFIIYLSLSGVIVGIMAFFETSYRKVPIQQTGTGLNLIDSKQTYMPIKTNPAGVIPVIFASALITLVPMIAQFFPEENMARVWITENFALTSPFGLTLYALLTFGFSLFYAHININSEETAENFQKNSTFILGVKPGKTTEKYLSQRVTSMAVLGGVILTLIAIAPYIMQMAGVPQAFTIGGTSTIIVISVAIDIWENVKARSHSSKMKREQMHRIKMEIEEKEWRGKAIFG